MRPEMSNLDFTIGCTVTFFSKKRRTPPNLNNGMYYPHFVIKGTEKYLGINFIDGEDVIFDKEIGANTLLLYETVDYSALQAGTEFFIMEGGNIVGEGIVKEIFQHKPYGSK
jgi:translation elongation factor Tu